MNARLFLVLALFVSLLVSVTTASSAQTISTNIGGSPGPSGPSPLNIAGNYPNGVTIAPVIANNGNARIEIISDGNADYLVMKNVKITTTAAIGAPGYAISFWATLKQLPNAAQPYDSILNGTLIKSNGAAATGDSVKLQGWYDATQVGVDKTCTIGALNTCSLSTSQPGLGGSPNDRTLKVNFWLTTLNANDSLNLANVKGATVKNSAAQDPCETKKHGNKKDCRHGAR